jgi:transketolase
MTTAKMKIDLDQLCINTIRTLSLDACKKPNRDIRACRLGMAPTAYFVDKVYAP